MLVRANPCVTSIALVASLVWTAPASAVPPITSSFDRGAEGWVIKDLSCANYAQVVGGGTVTWVAVGGDPGGFVRSTDPSGNCYSYEAPPAYVGDRSGYIGGTLRWSIRTNVADWLPGSVLIFIGDGLTLVADVAQPTTDAWNRYVVDLEAVEFRVGTAAGPVATPQQFEAAMANLTAIRISAEFGSELGEETVDLDSVALRGACIADLDGNGTVNAGDLAILLGAWGATSSIADFDASGSVDAADLALLLGAWGPCSGR